MTNKKNFFLCLILLFATPAFAIDFGVLAGLNKGKRSLSGTYANGLSANDDSSAKSALTYGLTANTGLIPFISLEADVLFNKNEQSDEALALSTSYRNIQIPVLARFWFLPLASVGFGGYYSMASGDITTTLGSVSSDISYEAAHVKKTDYGAVVSFNLTFPILPSISVLGDIRYNLGLANLNDDPSNPDVSVKYHSLQLLAGLTYSL